MTFIFLREMSLCFFPMVSQQPMDKVTVEGICMVPHVSPIAVVLSVGVVLFYEISYKRVVVYHL